MNQYEKYIFDFLTGQKTPAENTVRAEYLAEQAEILFKFVLNYASGGKADSLPVKLCICDTYDTFSYMAPVQIKGGKIEYYLVLDQHMNTVNTIINAIFLSENDSSHDVEKLIYELRLENSIAAKDKTRSEYFAGKKRELGDYHCKDAFFSSDNCFYVLVQMLYIIGHEIGHLIFSLSDEERQLWYSDGLELTEGITRIVAAELNSRLQTETNPEERERLLDEKSALSSKSYNEEIAADFLGIFAAIVFAHNIYVKKEEYRQFDNENLRLTVLEAVLIAIMNIEIVEVTKKHGSYLNFDKRLFIRCNLFGLICEIMFKDEKDEEFPEFDVFHGIKERYMQRIVKPFMNVLSQ